MSVVECGFMQNLSTEVAELCKNLPGEGWDYAITFLFKGEPCIWGRMESHKNRSGESGGILQKLFRGKDGIM